MAFSPRDEVLADGVDRAMTAWLNEHDISFPTLLEDAARGAMQVAMKEWLATHEEELINVFARVVAANLPRPGDGTRT